MVKLSSLPDQKVIDGWKGTVDFYLWMGIACARKWPHYPHREPYPDELANQQAFAYINQQASQLPQYIIDEAKRMATGTDFTWKDLIVRAYMSGIPYDFP